MNIDKKLGLTHLGLILLFALVMGTLGYRLITSSLQATQAEKLRLLSNDIAFDFAQKIRMLRESITSIADSRALAIYMDDFNERPLQELLRQQLVHFDRISILNESGIEELRQQQGGPDDPGEVYSLDAGFLDARWLPNQPVVQLQMAGDTPSAVVLNHVKQDFFDEFGGAIRATADLSTTLADILTTPADTFVLLLDPAGRVGFTNHTDGPLPRPGTRLACNATPSGEAGFSDCTGVAAFQLHQPLSDQGWTLITGITREQFNAPLLEIRNLILVALGLALAVAALISAILARHIKKPLGSLVAASRQLAAGDRDVAVPIQRRDELGDLGEAFNQMSRQLQHSREERDRALEGMAGVNRELQQRLTQLNQAHARIEYMAYNDELTGLANRRLLMGRLRQALASAGRHQLRGALLMFDLDRFKNINDSLGHEAGDRILQQVAERLSHAVRAEDTVCRLGGDEFVLLLPQIERDGDDILGAAARASEKIRRLLNEPYRLGQHRYRVTPSIGIVIFPHLDDGAEELLKRADTAMYRAKHDGGNQACFYELSMQEAADERLELEKDLQHALRSQALFLAYQAQFDLEGRIVSAEALLRWRHPTRGLVPPDQFIGVAEETGLISAMGTWVLQQACADMASLIAADSAPPTFSVNVSPHQFREPAFIDTVLEALKQHRIPPANLMLELTESALLHDTKSAVERMQQLREAGVRFALDDFGTGYSSLAYLSELPLNEVKIDRSFLLNAHNNPRNWTIIEAVIDIAGALELEVVVEGVETAQEVERLRDIGCRRFQGYHFARPQPLDDLRARLGARHGHPSATQ